MKNALSPRLFVAVLLLFVMGCDSLDLNYGANGEMVELLSDTYKKNYSKNNTYSSEARLEHFKNLLSQMNSKMDSIGLQLAIADTYLELGKEEEALGLLEPLVSDPRLRYDQLYAGIIRTAAIANMRMGERVNCINGHAGESCIFPIAGKGIHHDRAGSEKAINLYKQLLAIDPGDLESKWLLNVAYMTIDSYPDMVPANLLIPQLDEDSVTGVKPFVDAAINTGLNTRNMAGGSILEDFNNDGYLDLVTSSWGLNQGMHYCRNNADGSFTDISDSSGLSALTGGLHILQTDYNNDGLKDIFVLRGGWMGEFGKQPNSLLRNNGNGTFTDVTKQSGLLSLHPTQTATWADFNNDGWLDLFIGNETIPNSEPHPCELYINNQDGTFTEIAEKAGCNFTLFVKGVTSGDYNNDGLPDIFISTFDGNKLLLKNISKSDTAVEFENVSSVAGLDQNSARSFATWFWDYNNDGWLDILVCGYEFQKSLAWYAAAEALKKQTGNAGKVYLFRNKGDGTFEDVSTASGLDKITFAMGSNFGDFNNDGYLDFYLGTGNPILQSLVPNKMFLNKNGTHFADITSSSRTGNLQKGHGVSIADLDNDGDQDIYIDMGGAYEGDAYDNSLYINPGQSDNRWINITLEGTKSNRAAIGAKLKVSFEDNGVSRFVYREVNSGGSFGSNPLMQHIGIGQASRITSVEIQWPGSKIKQVFTDLAPNENLYIKEGSDEIAKAAYAIADFVNSRKGLISCGPVK